jgi:hypothetical protein
VTKRLPRELSKGLFQSCCEDLGQLRSGVTLGQALAVRLKPRPAVP